MQTDTLISVQHLYRYYGNLRAVDDLGFELRRGQVLGFLGPNGAGKTTTMQIIGGALAPSAGQVRVAGHDLLDEPLAAKSALGYLPEQPPVYREMRVDEYLRFCARLRRVPRRAVGRAVARAAEQCGLGEVLSRLIGNLSKGYQQRVGIAQAIIHEPQVVILDEPTVGLDPIQVREIRDLIRALGTERGVILSTHILPEVQAVCSHVQIIRQGQLVLSETIEGLQQRMHTTTLRVGLRCGPPDALRQVPGVAAVEAIDATHWRVSHDPARNPAEAIAEAAVRQGWGLFELSPEQRSLEQLFVELTTAENPESAEEAA